MRFSLSAEFSFYCAMTFRIPRYESGNRWNTLQGTNGLKYGRLSRGTGEDRMHAGIRTRSSWNFRCIVVAGTTSNLAAVPEKRDASRGWQQVGGPEWERGTRKRRRRHTIRVQTSSLSRASHKETKLTETFVLSPSWKQKVPARARVGKALSDYDKPLSPGWFIDLFSWYYRAIEIQCSSYARLIARLFYVISIGVETVDDYDVNKLHRNCTVEWYRNSMCAFLFHSKR